ncbi:MAG: T9SS type A sorting domain-containing protein [Bacteroidota bacterium]
MLAQTPSWVWARMPHGVGNDIGNSIASDASGNIYVTGQFVSDTIKFGAYTLVNHNRSNTYTDIFVAKYNSSGNVIWARNFGGYYDDAGKSIALDASGNIYLTGNYNSGSIAFDTAVLTRQDTNSTYNNVFITKLNNSGNVIWAKSAGGGYGDDVANSIAVNASGESYITGKYQSAVINFGTIMLTNPGFSSSFFIAQYDNTGNEIWANGSSASSSVGNALTIDGNGNLYVAGTFNNDTVSFGTTTLTNHYVNYQDVFLFKYSSAHNPIWARSAGGSIDDYATAIITDANQNIYLTGSFQNKFYISTDSLMGGNSGWNDIYLAKYTSSGNLAWVKGITGDNYDNTYGITCDIFSYVYITGTFASSYITFGGTTFNNTNGYGREFFVTKYDTLGQAHWAARASGTGDDWGSGVTVSGTSVYVIGNTNNWPSIAFGTDTTIISNGNLDGFYLAKLDVITGEFENKNADQSTFSVYPNPASGIVTIKCKIDKIVAINVMDVLGNIVDQKWHFENDNYQIDLSHLAKGIYFIEVISTNTKFETKKIIIH